MARRLSQAIHEINGQVQNKFRTPDHIGPLNASHSASTAIKMHHDGQSTGSFPTRFLRPIDLVYSIQSGPKSRPGTSLYSNACSTVSAPTDARYADAQALRQADPAPRYVGNQAARSDRRVDSVRSKPTIGYFRAGSPLNLTSFRSCKVAHRCASTEPRPQLTHPGRAQSSQSSASFRGPRSSGKGTSS